MLSAHLSQKNKTIISTINRGKIFIIISLLNSIMPILLCIISAFVNPFGSQVVMGVGYVSAFLLTFSQVGISFAISTFFLLAKKFKEIDNNNYSKQKISEIMTHSIYISILMGVVLSIFFAASSYLYLFFSCNRPNTMQTIEYGMDFV
jgi:membrane-anchored glycerophosphoryl diester phosphodiesterase (GDPDase)